MKKLLLALFLFTVPCSAEWIATPTEKMVEAAKLRVDVEYSNGAAKLIKVHRVDTYAQFLAEVKAELSRLEAVDASLLKVEIGTPVDTKVAIPSPTPSTPPTQAELDRMAFFTNYAKLQRLKEAVAQKVIEANDEQVVALEALVKSQFKPEYFQ